MKAGFLLDPLISKYLLNKNLIELADISGSNCFWNRKKPVPYIIKTEFQKVIDGRSYNGKAESSVAAIQKINESKKQKRQGNDVGSSSA